MKKEGALLTWFAAGFASVPVTVVLHELGHYLAGKFLGWRDLAFALLLGDSGLRRPGCRECDSRSMEGCLRLRRRPDSIPCDPFRRRFVGRPTRATSSPRRLRSLLGSPILVASRHRDYAAFSRDRKELSQAGRIQFCRKHRDTTIVIPVL